MSTNTTPTPDDEGPIERIGELEVKRVSGDIQKHADLSTRSKARKQALDILFEADLMGTDPLDVLAARPDVFTNPVRPFAADLVRGVTASQAGLDSVLADCLAAGWTLARMPRVDRVLARLGAFEILHTDTPNPAVISEAIELSEEFSTDDSAPFLSGVLNAVIAHGPARVAEVSSADGVSAEVAEDGENTSEKSDDTDSVASKGIPDPDPLSHESDNVGMTTGNGVESPKPVDGAGLKAEEPPTSKDHKLGKDLDKSDPSRDQED
ncbi:transcription antitermination factor NusB [Cutibacterium equinum]|uniref:Transcription antitermination protein NusB n=1 Tax=Cutibacterium equinum TaxID=3016342 RepID=A0ABY7R0Q6_9ACTN|nr:transcription antitermination factor NusB [Cutibacterium equinum]WCC80876.1 transcription antitermination factor NusB [Cutibacterium equinum]